MTDEEKQTIVQDAKTGVAAVGEKISAGAGAAHAWFSGHPGAAVALSAGLVIGWVVGYLWPR